jgi:hypothetical protein
MKGKTKPKTLNKIFYPIKISSKMKENLALDKQNREEVHFQQTYRKEMLEKLLQAEKFLHKN